MRLTLPRLYAILDTDLVSRRGLEPLAVLENWLSAGVRLVQLRAKSMALGPMTTLAERAYECSTSVGALFFVNDRADVARLVRATGVHVGQADLTVAEARRVLTPGQAVGLSTHDVSQALQALEDGADYIAIGPVYSTSTKVNPDPVVGLTGVRNAAEQARAASRPVVAIGGITLAAAPEVIAAGADSVAVISDLFTGDWRVRAREFVRALD